MTAAPASRPVDDSDRFLRAVRQRRRVGRLRPVEAALIATLAWFATHDLALALWFGAVLLTGLLEALSARHLLGHPTEGWPRRLAAACQALSAISYASVAIPLLTNANVIGLAEAAFVLCAVALGNALQSSGSRLATVCLLGPPSAFLIGSPLWVGIAGDGLPLSDTVLLALGGIAYTLFVLRLSAAAHAERAALRAARGEAEAGARRWRMMFDYSPMSRLCLDASRLYALLQTHARGRTNLGDVLRAEVPLETLVRHIQLLDANLAAKALLGRGVADAHVSPDFMEAFCLALNDIDERGVMPPFEGEIILDGGELLFVQAHYRMSPGPDAPWSFCVGTYADMTEARRMAIAQDEARRAAEEANRTKSDFLTMMSHEIRTPLNGVLGMAQAMAADPLAPIQRDRLQVIRESGIALMDLLDHLLDTSSLESNRPAPDSDDAHAAFDALPTRAEQAAAAPTTLSFVTAPGEGAMRVLAAEDNPVNRLVLKALLAQFDVEPTLVENGDEAVRAWEAAHWDLILMDVQMPVMDGPTATMTIRAREGMTGRPRTPIVAVTANTLPHQVASYRAAGMDGVVAKPLNLNALFATMIAAMDSEAEIEPGFRAVG